MKLTLCIIAICFLLAISVVRSDRDDPPCEVDEDCKLDECCVLDYPGDRKVCRDEGDDPGDACGGPYFCSHCGRGLFCKPVVKTIHEPISGCFHPANGTCEWKARKGAGRRV